MCGIVGSLVFDHSDFVITPAYLCPMRDAMVHRGPDGKGIWISADARIGLGHRRLAIIDLAAAANQPLANADGSIWISFNGEIYNHREIRQQLEQTSNYRWSTDHSDTEVIVYAFEEWGIACLEKFQGMFAFALWDGRYQQLWLVRDRIGVKPLYYSIHHGRITFASEIKALLQDKQQPRQVNEEALFHYLSFVSTPAPDTLFIGIHKLPPGNWLCIQPDGSIRQQCYWDVWNQVQPLVTSSEPEIAERLLLELERAVKLRQVSDVPVGIFLSGGIDSSTNAALFAQGRQEKIKTFSIGYDREYHSYKNELHYARQVARLINAEHYELLLSVDSLLDFLPQMVYLQDEPIADPVCVPVYYVAKLARDNGVIVCQVGEGADELFCGYPQWQRFLNLQKWYGLPLPRFGKSLLALGLSGLGYQRNFYHEWLCRAAAGHPIFWGGANIITEWQKHRLLSPRLRKKFRGYNSWERIRPGYRHFQENAWDQSPLQWMSYRDLTFRLPELLLMRVDKMSMAVGLEGRVPFLDHKFVELAMSIPPRLKNQDGILKYILKKSIRGLIPDAVIDRRKQGFGVPIYEWFFDRLGTKIRQELAYFCAQTDFLDPREINALIRRGQGPQIWPLFNFAMWWRTFIA